ncbi:uncharacterized protein LOC111315515 isoform X2 [Durio zibethinus]|uniref:Uncharacterized protein LOC111315515 isoform X2 n=1 Tax=Durio zibethinus TaxID=66656 RepID=A0A6P6B813_DURZI|nr:uncharacterized protein LOC111315515 isoform X2 [Durio zibethinus]
MGNWEVFLELLANVFTVLCWYVSIRILETNSCFRNQQCLTYWVLFALIAMVELTLGKVLKWFPFWPYAKGVATILLVTPYFGGASYVFKHLIRPYYIEKLWNFLLLPKTKGVVSEAQNGIVYNADTNRLKNGPKLEKVTTGQGNFDLSSDSTEVNLTWSTHPKRVQREWSCVLCLINTSSEKCLKKHLRGKKHKTKEDELRLDDLPFRDTCKLSSVPKKAERVVFLRNLNIEGWSDLLNPVTRSIRWCKWQKPEIGCIKLNTDGSVDPENSGFGGLFRDYKGDPLCAFVSKAPQDDIFLVELWAIWRGLVLALGLGIKVIWVESDSMSVVKTINREQQYGAKSSRCLKQIWKLLTKFENHRVTHSWRESNKAADHLSKMVLRESDVVLWPVDFPDSLNNIIKDDALGKIYFRR